MKIVPIDDISVRGHEVFGATCPAEGNDRQSGLHRRKNYGRVRILPRAEEKHIGGGKELCNVFGVGHKVDMIGDVAVHVHPKPSCSRPVSIADPDEMQVGRGVRCEHRYVDEDIHALPKVTGAHVKDYSGVLSNPQPSPHLGTRGFSGFELMVQALRTDYDTFACGQVTTY